MSDKACSMTVYDGAETVGRSCRNRASVQRKGYWYCSRHDPKRKPAALVVPVASGPRRVCLASPYAVYVNETADCRLTIKQGAQGYVLRRERNHAVVRFDGLTGVDVYLPEHWLGSSIPHPGDEE